MTQQRPLTVLLLLNLLIVCYRQFTQAQNMATTRANFPTGCGSSCLLIANTNNLLVVNTDNMRTTTFLSGLNRAVALEIDRVRGYIYWSDAHDFAIRRANMDGTNVTLLFRNKIGICDGLAMDERAGKLYWTDSSHDVIEVADVYSPQLERRVLFNVSLDQPRGIAVENDEGYLFWTDWGRKAKIERSTLSGESRKIIVFRGLAWPNGIATDRKNKKLIWAEAKLDKIEMSDYNGNNRQLLYRHNGIHPFGIVMQGSFLRWTDWMYGLQTMNISDRGSVISYRLPAGTPYAVKSFTRAQSPTFNCTFDNGMCGMTQSAMGVFNWTLHNGTTVSPGTGPLGDHTTGSGNYMYTEASLKQENDTALLLSPVLFTGSSTYVSSCVQFWFHMYGNHMGTFRVKVNGKTLWQRSGSQGNRWIHTTLSFRAKNSYQIAFEGIIGPDYKSDMAIDDVVIATGERQCNILRTTSPPTTRLPPTKAPEVTKVRLVNGTTFSDGRIEVLVRGTWGTVCDDNFDVNDANVFCLMLGFPGAIRDLCCATPYGRGSGPIWLDDLRCEGKESSINECPHSGIGRHNCKHDQDAGVVCKTSQTTTKSPNQTSTTTRTTPFPTRLPGLSSIATHCNFDHDNCGLSNVKDDDFDWLLWTGATPSIATGPSRDLSGKGRYYYMEATGHRQGLRARLQSRPLRLYYRACLTFYYHMYGSDMGTLKVLLNGRLVWQINGNQGDQWHIATVPIFLPGLKKVTFEGIVGKGFRSDIAIDEISLVEHESWGPTSCVFAPNGARPSTTPSTETCGMSPQAPNSLLRFRRIIGHVIDGNNARRGAWPWQIALYYYGDFHCGGSLIRADWVLTAAHCVADSEISSYKIVLGDHNRNRSEGSEQSINVRRIISHLDFSLETLNNDVALIQLARPATFNSRVGIVCLPSENSQFPVGHPCYITGWGKIRHPGSAHHILQQALLPVVNSSVCERKVKASPDGANLTITPQMVCGGEEGSLKSGCHGDSGGPWVCRRRDGSWVLEGAVSWASPRCDARERFTVFARINQFRGWIDSLIGAS